MIGPRNATLGEEIFREIENNEYLKEIYLKILIKYSHILFDIAETSNIEINIIDALKFADLLSKSAGLPNSEKHTEMSQEIVALLNVIYPNNESVQLYTNSVLSSIGNYRGLQLVSSNISNNSFFENLYQNYDKQYLAIPFQDNMYFFPTQKRIYEKLDDEFFSYSGPTSMGKSLVMRTFIKEKIINGSNDNFAIIVPTKALINEITASIIDSLKELLREKNYVVINSAGALALNESHKFIFILTPERLLYLLINYPNINIGYLFIDEAHKISSNDPRSTFYYKVTDMLSQRERRPNIIFASPNIPNPDIYLELIPDISNKKKNVIKTTFSPVSHLKYFVDLIDNSISIYNDLSNRFHSLFNINEDLSNIQFIKRHSGFQNDIQSIIYCNSKESAINSAIEFAADLDELGAQELDSLATEIKNEIHSVYYLADLIKKGVAFHVGYLPSYIRNSIEKLYRERKITTLFCTSTLMEGVNLPADNLFILSYKNGTSDMKPVEFKNLVGRVGRIEFNLYGNIFFMRFKESQEKEKYMNLVGADVPEQKLSLLSSLTKGQKEKIIDSLIQGNIKLLKYPKDQTASNYSLMRKFALILLGDIINNRESLVYTNFKPWLNNEKLTIIKNKFSNDNIAKPDDDINVSVDQSKRLIIAIKDGLAYPPSDNGEINYNDLLEFLETLSEIFNWDYYEKKT
ncbi:MAG TPA: DEAD/DEAH box helicase, partial [Gallicola sp.]|nr:DEAD/DEAH box helicase [Gallicola sp.]